MTTITRAELESLASMYGTVIGQSHAGPLYNRYREREVTINMIVEFVSSAPSPVTRREIAKHLKRSKSPGLYQILDELVRAGQLVKQYSICPNGQPKYWYSALM